MHKVHDLGRWGRQAVPDLIARLNAIPLEDGQSVRVYLVTGGPTKDGNQCRALISKETHVDTLLLGPRVRMTLRQLGIWYLEDFSAISESELLKEKGFGASTIKKIKDWMDSVGLSFRRIE